MKNDSINRLHGRKILLSIPGPLASKACEEAGLNYNLPHVHSYCAYIYGRNHLQLTHGRTEFSDFPKIPTYAEYLKMKRERLRRYRISQTMRDRFDGKRLGLSGIALDTMMFLFKKERLSREDS